MAFCPHCGASVQGGAFCASCGRSLAPAPRLAEPVAAASVAPAVRPLASPERPMGVTLAAVGFFLLAAGAGLVALFLISLAPLLDAAPFWFYPFSYFFGALAVGFFVVILAFAVLAGAVGYGLLNAQAWAWVGALVVAGLAALSNVSQLAVADFSGVLGLLVWGGLIYYFLRPEVRAYFGRP